MRKEERTSHGSCGAVGEKVEEEQDSQVFLLTAWVRVERAKESRRKSRIGKKEGEFGFRHAEVPKVPTGRGW